MTNETLITNYNCNNCKYCCDDGSCKVYTYDKPKICNEFVIRDDILPTEDYFN